MSPQIPHNKIFYGFHFLYPGWALRNRVGQRSIAPKNNVPLEYKNHIRLCASGLHAAFTICDAIRYAPSTFLTFVKCTGLKDYDNNKFVCKTRTILHRKDIAELIVPFITKFCIYHLNPDFQIAGFISDDYYTLLNKTQKDASKPLPLLVKLLDIYTNTCNIYTNKMYYNNFSTPIERYMPDLKYLEKELRAFFFKGVQFPTNK